MAGNGICYDFTEELKEFVSCLHGEPHVLCSVGFASIICDTR